MSNSILGHLVEIHSVAGIVYEGRVRSIRKVADFGEIFELGSDSNADFQRLIHVVDRLVQIREISPLAEPSSRDNSDR